MVCGEISGKGEEKEREREIAEKDARPTGVALELTACVFLAAAAAAQAFFLHEPHQNRGHRSQHSTDPRRTKIQRNSVFLGWFLFEPQRSIVFLKVLGEVRRQECSVPRMPATKEP